ncbi:EAL domain-containing response regulator [Rhodobacteraceae bacterium 2376]|uniref:EAL domain-containing response regulator n=1 Tax=Rhabdonatronobacter sediminivivens TaxID=2743469 RepID=A0A7Z0I1M6_9RHOB|nr:EAL domain-containing response regulator [Rhabdonatronobacter sediminivivens]NYS26170.1 EAL domain-containing response regulator [Rhabdonatronobacter sediminivivens]
MSTAKTSGRLIILDDDAMIAETIANIAQSLNFETLVALQASEFLEQLQVFNPTHAIIDLSMPEVDGLEVLRKLDGQCRAKVIIASGSDSRILEAARRVGLAHGADVIGTLQKPFRAKHLKALLWPVHPAIAETVEPEPDTHTRQRFTKGELRDALARDEFTIYLQPKVRCSDDCIVGFEALARWNHPTKGLILPGEFIDLFEEYGLETIWMEKLVRLVTSCISDKLPEGMHLSLNMSMSRHSREFASRFPTMIRSTGTASSRIVIEVIENGLNDATTEDIEMFARLRLNGFELSIDDFGSGYSSLSRLVQIPFTELKIDRSFVREVRDSAEARNMLRSVVSIGRSLGMAVIAEGVEDAETLEIVKSLGCDIVQGFVYSRPLPIEQAVCWMFQSERLSS